VADSDRIASVAVFQAEAEADSSATPPTADDTASGANTACQAPEPPLPADDQDPSMA
jgi:hypothetical protein